MNLNDNQKILDQGYNTSVNPQNNCAKLDGKISVHNMTGLVDDSCLQQERLDQSVEASDYMVSNFRSCGESLTDILKVAGDNKGLTVKDGYDVSKNNIQESSKVRFGEVEHRPKCSNLLLHRPFATVPYMGRGYGDNEVEADVKTGSLLHKRDRHVAKNEQQERTFNNIMVPLVKNLSDNVQNPMNLVEEVNDQAWVRGGAPTRQIVKDLDYFDRSKDLDENKEYIKAKKGYMHHCL